MSRRDEGGGGVLSNERREMKRTMWRDESSFFSKILFMTDERKSTNSRRYLRRQVGGRFCQF